MMNKNRTIVYRRIAAVLMALLLLFSGTRPAEAAVITELHPNLEGKWLFLGDSYTTAGTGEDRLFPLIRQRLGLNAADCRTIAKGGYGFVRKTSTKDLRYATFVQDDPVDKGVTNILIIGGIYNDRSFGRVSTQREMLRFFGLLRRKYPNAVIWYAAPNWHANWKKKTEAKKKEAVSYQETVKKRGVWYRQFCKLRNVVMIETATTALHADSNDSYFATDGHHPSLKGRQKIADVIAQSIVNCRASVVLKAARLAEIRARMAAKAPVQTLGSNARYTAAASQTQAAAASSSGTPQRYSISSALATAKKPGYAASIYGVSGRINYTAGVK